MPLSKYFPNTVSGCGIVLRCSIWGMFFTPKLIYYYSIHSEDIILDSLESKADPIKIQLIGIQTN